ncbi:unnamed protein product [Dovyalis caffra]|uniref:Large ribosomal subunit protein uL22c n=1 Tax=Dovyalis caffra TaxID=77055 RepID=A0AAV1RYQ2_9ROSI|nr:unnamed protein product [Dovyalis caffra]
MAPVQCKIAGGMATPAFEMPESSSMKELKIMIKAITGICVDRQTLRFNRGGVELENVRSVGSYGFREEALIHLDVTPLPGDPEFDIFLRLSDRALTTMKVKETYTVGYLRQKIKHLLNIPIDKIALIRLDDSPMKEYYLNKELRLSDYYICNNNDDDDLPSTSLLGFEVMVVWQRHLQSLIRQVRRRAEHNYIASSANFSAITTTTATRSDSSVLTGELPCLQRLWKLPSANVSTRPFYRLLQQSGISSSRKLLADSSEEQPVSSLLTPVLAIGSGKTEEQNAVSKPEKVQAVLKGIKMSPKKLNLVAALVRGMRVEDALLQLQVTVKRAAKTVYQVIHSARANATHNHGLDPDRLLVAESFVGKGFFKKRVAYHAKGRSGVREKPECRLTVVVRETTPEEEAKIAKLRVHNFRKLTKKERQLVPHKLIETTSIWNRKGKAADRQPSGMAA